MQIQEVGYKIKLSKRAKRMRIAVYSDSSVVLTLPWNFSKISGESFLKSKLNWILKSIGKFKVSGMVRYRKTKISKSEKKEYARLKTQALILAKTKVEQWNKVYNLKYNKIGVKNQKTRWGSCSKRGNLNFNYKIIHLSESTLDYLIVHELCHLQEFNHSANFWNLVSETIPNYKKLRHELKQFQFNENI